MEMDFAVDILVLALIAGKDIVDSFVKLKTHKANIIKKKMIK